MPTLTYTLGKFVWRELLTRDVEAAKRFYGGLFGWTSKDSPMGPEMIYTLWYNGETQIGGMMDIAALPDGEGVPPNWGVYVSVEDVDAAAARAVEAGAQIMGECHDIPGVGRFAVVQDPQGVYFNLYRSASGDPEDEMPKVHEFCWEALVTPDPAKALAFYEKVVGWGVTNENGTPLFTRAGRGDEALYVANVSPTSAGVPPHWATYVAVETLEATNAKCRELGGQVLVERIPVPGYGAFSVLQDPTGAYLNAFEPELA